MDKPSRPKVVFVDVDDTLVRSFGAKRIPIIAVIGHVRQLHRAGFELYCWSSGGADYARQSAADLELSDCFAGFLPKPDAMIDDQHPADWTTMSWVHTNEAGSRSPDDY